MTKRYASGASVHLVAGQTPASIAATPISISLQEHQSTTPTVTIYTVGGRVVTTLPGVTSFETVAATDMTINASTGLITSNFFGGQLTYKVHYDFGALHVVSPTYSAQCSLIHGGPNEPAGMTVLQTNGATSISESGWAWGNDVGLHVGPRGKFAIGTDPTKLQTLQTMGYNIAGTDYTKAATDGIPFSAAHRITAGKFGIILIQINAAGTFTTKVPSATQAYAKQIDARGALPNPYGDSSVSPDAGNVFCGFVPIEAEAGADWVAGTDTLSSAVGAVDIDSLGFKRLPYDSQGAVRNIVDSAFTGTSAKVLEFSYWPSTVPGNGQARLDLTYAESFFASEQYNSYWFKLSNPFTGNDGAGSLKGFACGGKTTYGFGTGGYLIGWLSDTANPDTGRTRMYISLIVMSAHDGIDLSPHNNISYYTPAAGDPHDIGDVCSLGQWHYFEGIFVYHSKNNKDGSVQAWIDSVSAPITSLTDLTIIGMQGTGLSDDYPTMGPRWNGGEGGGEIINNTWGGGGTKRLCDNYYRFGDIYVSGKYARAGERPDHWHIETESGLYTVASPSSVNVMVQLRDENDSSVDIGAYSPSSVSFSGMTGLTTSAWNGSPTYDDAQGGSLNPALTRGRSYFTINVPSGKTNGSTFTLNVSDHATWKNGQNSGDTRSGSKLFTIG